VAPPVSDRFIFKIHNILRTNVTAAKISFREAYLITLSYISNRLQIFHQLAEQSAVEVGIHHDFR